jgi:uncharacterized GH25 family protein
MLKRSVRLSVWVVLLSLTALGHYTWVAPVAQLETGKPATIRISHGHKFPASEEAINARQVDLVVVSPSGQRTKLDAKVSAQDVTAVFTPRENGAHRIAFSQDRGVSSRTPKGVKPGGRDQNPDATQAYRTFRTAVAYAATGPGPATGGKPLGFELELTGEWVAGSWHIQLLKLGKPVGGVPLELFLAGAAKASEIGKTNPDGKVIYSPPAGIKGPAMFSVAFKDSAPAGAHYDHVNYESSLYVSW